MVVQSCEEKISEKLETASLTEHQRHSRAEAPRLDQNQFTRKLNALKKLFSTSLNCFNSTIKPGEGSSHDAHHAVTILNRHARDSVDLNTAGGLSASEIHKFSNAEHKSSVEDSEANQLLNQHIFYSKRHSKSLGLKAFWRQKPRKTLFQHFGETEAYMADEIIVLANEHADEST